MLSRMRPQSSVKSAVRLLRQASSSDTQTTKKLTNLTLRRYTTKTTTEIKDAASYLSPILTKYADGCFFTGITQYYDTPDYDNIIMLRFDKDFIEDMHNHVFSSRSVLDCALFYSDVDSFMKSVKSLSQLPVYQGEIDVVKDSLWEFGFVLNPFTIFSPTERICAIDEDKLLVRDRLVSVFDIEYVGLSVSEEPFNNRKMFLGIRSGERVPLLSVEKHYLYCDLPTIGMETEWHIKASALLCVNLSRLGNKDVHLRVSPVLQPQNNEWVAQRQKLWNDMIQRCQWDKDI